MVLKILVIPSGASCFAVVVDDEEKVETPLYWRE
jgi:hypothetical protein